MKFLRKLENNWNKDGGCCHIGGHLGQATGKQTQDEEYKSVIKCMKTYIIKKFGHYYLQQHAVLMIVLIEPKLTLMLME